VKAVGRNHRTPRDEADESDSDSTKVKKGPATSGPFPFDVRPGSLRRDRTRIWKPSHPCVNRDAGTEVMAQAPSAWEDPRAASLVDLIAAAAGAVTTANARKAPACPNSGSGCRRTRSCPRTPSASRGQRLGRTGGARSGVHLPPARGDRAVRSRGGEAVPLEPARRVGPGAVAAGLGRRTRRKAQGRHT
jgi:hypothetical protein